MSAGLSDSDDVWIPETPQFPAPVHHRVLVVPTTHEPLGPPTPDKPETPPKLGQLFTPEQTRENNRVLDETLERVKKALTELRRRQLTTDQTETVDRIQGFVAQAETQRNDDPVTAISLAQRADQLAKDLLQRIP